MLGSFISGSQLHNIRILFYSKGFCCLCLWNEAEDSRNNRALLEITIKSIASSSARSPPPTPHKRSDTIKRERTKKKRGIRLKKGQFSYYIGSVYKIALIMCIGKTFNKLFSSCVNVCVQCFKPISLEPLFFVCASRNKMMLGTMFIIFIVICDFVDIVQLILSV